MNERKWIDAVTLEGAKTHYKDFSGKRYQGQRAIGIVLDEQVAMDLEQQGWKIKHLEATDQYPEKHYIDIKIKYGYDRNGKYRHPDIYMICGDTMTLLDEESVNNLDSAEIENIDLTFTPNFYEDKVTAYLQKAYVTIRQDYLDYKYEKFKNGPVNNEYPDEIPFE